MRHFTSLLLMLAVAFTGVASDPVSGASVSQIQAVITSEAITASMAETQPAAARKSSCSKPSYGEPPKTIRVFRIHKKGSRIPARIDTVPFKTYVGRVMAAGAWPAYKPMESLKAGAAVIAQRAWWMINHHNPRFRWHGRCFDIMPGSSAPWCRGCDDGQYYIGTVYVHSKIRRAVDAVWGTVMYKRGRFIKPQWSGDGGSCGRSVNGFRLPEDAVTKCARKGWSYRRILRHYFAPVRIRFDENAQSSASAVKSPAPSASPTAVFGLSVDFLSGVSENLGILIGSIRQAKFARVQYGPSVQSTHAVNRVVS